MFIGDSYSMTTQKYRSTQGQTRQHIDMMDTPNQGRQRNSHVMQPCDRSGAFLKQTLSQEAAKLTRSWSGLPQRLHSPQSCHQRSPSRHHLRPAPGTAPSSSRGSALGRTHRRCCQTLERTLGGDQVPRRGPMSPETHPAECPTHPTPSKQLPQMEFHMHENER